MTPDRAASEQGRSEAASFEAALKSLRQRSGTSQDVQIVRLAYDALRAERDEARLLYGKAVADIGQLVVERDEARAERDAAVADAEGFRNGQLQVQASFDSLWSDASALRAEVATLTADNERLRTALTEISGHGCYRTNATAGPVGDALDHLSECVHVACAAIAEKKP